MPRLCLKPSSQLGRDCRKWIGSMAQSLRFRPCYAGRPHLTLLPCRAQPREELLQCRGARFRRITEDGTFRYCDKFLLDRTDLPLADELGPMWRAARSRGLAPDRASVGRQCKAA